MTATEVKAPRIYVNMPDINAEDTIPLGEGEVEYQNSRDYLRSGYNIMLRQGFDSSSGWDVEVHGDIPINAGTSSSSALVTCWLLFLSRAGNVPVDPTQLATLGYLTEVKEFNEAGGMMDHFTSSYGKLLFLETAPEFIPHPLPAQLGGFVLAYSGPKRCTVDDLRFVKNSSLQSFEDVKEVFPSFDPHTTTLEELSPYLDSLSETSQKFLVGQVKDRDLTLQARDLFAGSDADEHLIGEYLNAHHTVLRDNLGISTDAIETLLSLAIDAGAVGGKINGSGFGGCMFAYCPGNQDPVLRAIIDAGFDAWAIDVAPGASEE
jgi:galactokinase